MTFAEVLHTSKLYSISGKLIGSSLVCQRPFRDPHHTISQAGLVGGGSYPQPGEVSLAHHGILFLDELTEFKRHTLEALRQPLESNSVTIARAQQSVSFPASFLLVAALNPCPCGYFGDKKKTCVCPSNRISKYLEKLSGPLLDRIDLHVNVQAIEYDDIKAPAAAQESSTSLFAKVEQALQTQYNRFGTTTWNAHMNSDAVATHCTLTDNAEAILKKAFEKLNLSMRSYHKILKIARTIADLEGAQSIDVPHLQEALMYRSLDQILEKQ
jgi:magnesium chelatase family protein